MRRFLLAVVIAGLGLPRPLSAQIKWYATFEDASTGAQREAKPILLDFWAEWCLPCKVMDSEVYPNDEVVQAAAPFALVRIDFDRKPTLARRYRVENMPTLVLTDSYGRELFRYSGFIGAPALSALLRSLPHDVSEFNRLSRMLDRNQATLSAHERIGPVNLGLWEKPSRGAAGTSEYTARRPKRCTNARGHSDGGGAELPRR